MKPSRVSNTDPPSFSQPSESEMRSRLSTSSGSRTSVDAISAQAQETEPGGRALNTLRSTLLSSIGKPFGMAGGNLLYTTGVLLNALVTLMICLPALVGAGIGGAFGVLAQLAGKPDGIENGALVGAAIAGTFGSLPLVCATALLRLLTTCLAGMGKELLILTAPENKQSALSQKLEKGLQYSLIDLQILKELWRTYKNS